MSHVKGFLYNLLLVIVFLFALVVLIAYSRGYKINFENKSIGSTGILVASSYPTGAKIFVNGVLKGATNTNISLPPGQYLVEIKREGYSTWKKNISIKGEVVIKADALLFPINPSLSPITSLGINRAMFSEKFNTIILVSSNNDPLKDGIYTLQNSDKSLSIFNPLKLIALKTIFDEKTSLTDSALELSPDGKQLMISSESAFLISAEEENKQTFNITKSKETVIDAWTNLNEKNTEKILETFKEPLPKIASEAFRILSFSPDDTKILYQAKQSISLPPILLPPLIGTNQSKEERNLVKNNLYVYDEKEDKNFPVTFSKSIELSTIEKHIAWYPDSKHLVINEDRKINVVDYDGDNKQTVYSGPFESDFFAITGDGKLLILANLNPQSNLLPDVYAVGIK
jgi:hypothetical protein